MDQFVDAMVSCWLPVADVVEGIQMDLCAKLDKTCWELSRDLESSTSGWISMRNRDSYD